MYVVEALNPVAEVQMLVTFALLSCRHMRLQATYATRLSLLSGPCS